MFPTTHNEQYRAPTFHKAHFSKAREAGRTARPSSPRPLAHRGHPGGGIRGHARRASAPPALDRLPWWAGSAASRHLATSPGLPRLFCASGLAHADDAHCLYRIAPGVADLVPL